jgi:hypothetical protein
VTVNTNGNAAPDMHKLMADLKELIVDDRAFKTQARRVLDMWTIRGMPHPDHARAVAAVRELFPPLAAALDGLCDAHKVARP